MNKIVFYVISTIIFGSVPAVMAGRGGARQRMIVHQQNMPPSSFVAVVAFVSKAPRDDTWFLDREQKQEEDAKRRNKRWQERLILDELNRNREKAAARRRARSYPSRTFHQMMRDHRMMCRQDLRSSAVELVGGEDSETLKEERRIAYEAQLARDQYEKERIRFCEEEMQYARRTRMDRDQRKAIAVVVGGEFAKEVVRIEAELEQEEKRIRELKKRDEEMMLPRLRDLVNAQPDVEGKRGARNFLVQLFFGAEDYLGREPRFDAFYRKMGL